MNADLRYPIGKFSPAKHVSPEERGCTHPQNGRRTVEHIAALYAWHGRHHTVQIAALRERMGW